MNYIYKSFANANPGLKILFSLGIAFIFMLVFLFLSSLIAMIFFDFEVGKLNDASTNPLQGDNLNVLRLLQIGQTIGMFLVPAWVLAWIFGKKPGTYLKTNKGFLIISLILVVVMVFLIQPFINLTAVANRLLVLPSSMNDVQTWMMESEKSAEINTLAFLEVSSGWILVFNIVMVGVLPAIAEEFFFRGVIQKLFVDWSKNLHLGILFSALLFSAFHMQFYTFLPRLIMGIYLGYLFVWSGSMWIPVFAHFVNNSVGVVGIYLLHNNYLGEQIEATELTGSLIITGLISVVICTGLLLLIRKKSLA